MKSKILIVLSFLFFTNINFSQNKLIDSLKIVLKENKTPKEIANTNINIRRVFRGIDIFNLNFSIKEVFLFLNF